VWWCGDVVVWGVWGCGGGRWGVGVWWGVWWCGGPGRGLPLRSNIPRSALCEVISLDSQCTASMNMIRHAAAFPAYAWHFVHGRPQHSLVDIMTYIADNSKLCSSLGMDGRFDANLIQDFRFDHVPKGLQKAAQVLDPAPLDSNKQP
jgi:hypothetical protein